MEAGLLLMRFIMSMTQDSQELDYILGYIKLELSNRYPGRILAFIQTAQGGPAS